MTLSFEDHLAIQQLYADYAIAVDSGRWDLWPGFFTDECSVSYNALTIARHGSDEWGIRFPLFFKAGGEYKNPVFIYLLAAVFWMIGPSAPKGPPVPMAKAVAIGFKTPTRIRTRLFPSRTASIASGIPWPFRVGSQKWTRMPTSSPPTGGMRMTQVPRW